MDPEWVIEQNPDIIIKSVSYKISGYGVDDPSGMAAVIDEVMNRSELANILAVKNRKVYCSEMSIRNIRYFVGLAYWAKWFHPELFEDLDPKAINEEYLEKFQGMPYRGIYVYPELN